MKGMREIKGKKAKALYDEVARKDLIYPELHIDLKYLPEAKTWKIGQEYPIALKVKMRSMREDEASGNAGFDIVAIGTGPATKGKKKAKGEKGPPVRRYTKAEVEAEESDEDD